MSTIRSLVPWVLCTLLLVSSVSAQTNARRSPGPRFDFQRVLQRAVFHVQSSGKNEVTGPNVLVAIFSEKQSQAVYFLGLQDITRLDVVNYISHGMPQLPGESGGEDPESQVEGEGEAEASPLEQYATNLNQMAVDGSISSVSFDPRTQTSS